MIHIRWIDIVNFLKGKPRRETLKNKKVMEAFHNELLEEKLRRDYEEDLMAEAEQAEREQEERHLNKLWEE